MTKYFLNPKISKKKLMLIDRQIDESIILNSYIGQSKIKKNMSVLEILTSFYHYVPNQIMLLNSNDFDFITNIGEIFLYHETITI